MARAANSEPAPKCDVDGCTRPAVKGSIYCKWHKWAH